MESDDNAAPEATLRRIERRPSLSFHGIAKSPAAPAPASPGLKSSFPSSLRHLDRRLSVEFAAAPQQPPVARKASLGVPSSSSQLSRRNSLEVPQPAKDAAQSGQSTPSASPRSPLSASSLQRRNSLEVPFDRRLSEERRPSAEAFMLARRISIDEATSLGNSPIRRLSSSSFTGIESADADDRVWTVPFGRRDSRGSSVSEAEGSSSTRQSPGRTSPTAAAGTKRPASLAFDYTAFEPAGPEPKRPRSPSLPRIPSPLHAGSSQLPSVGSGDVPPPSSGAKNAGSRSPRAAPEKPDSSNLLAAPGSGTELWADSEASTSANESEDAGRDQPATAPTAATDKNRSPSPQPLVASIANDDQAPLMASVAVLEATKAKRGEKDREKIQVVAYDEESGATVTLDHDNDTAEIQLECPPVRGSPARKSF